MLSTVVDAIALAMTVYLFLLLARWAADLAARLARGRRPHGALALGLEALYVATDPPLKFLRSHIPPLRIRGVSFDLGFLLLTVVIIVAQSWAIRIGG